MNQNSGQKKRERELEEKSKRFYDEWVMILKKFYNFELTMAEAVFLKKICREVVEHDINLGNSESADMTVTWTFPEIMERFLWHYYGINMLEKPFVKLEPKEIFEMSKRKYRPEKEMI